MVTPYNSSDLPDPDPDEGLDQLLRSQPSVLLTAPSARRAVQGGHPHPAVVRRGQVRERTEALPGGNWFVDGADDIRVEPGSALGPFDAVWCCAFDERGSIVGRWRGPVALEVVRN